jgi:hypothetical protein
MRPRQSPFRRRLHALAVAVRRLLRVKSAKQEWESTWSERQAELEQFRGEGVFPFTDPIRETVGGGVASSM